MCDGIYNQDTICTQNSPSGFFLLRTWLPTAQKRLLTHKEESTIMTTLEKIEGPSLALEQVRKWFIVNLDGASDTPGKTGKKVWKSAAQIEFLRTWLPTAQKRLLMHKEDPLAQLQRRFHLILQLSATPSRAVQKEEEDIATVLC